MMDAKQKLQEILFLKDPGLLGCRRRNAWSDEGSGWRDLRGRALLHILGHKQCAETPVGDLEYYAHDGFLLHFRGGKWKGYWMEDFIDLWALVHTYDEDFEVERTFTVLQEDRGHLTVVHDKVPDGIDPEERAEEILAEFASDPPGRIPKNDKRALAICRRCPVRTRCNAADELRNDKSDWSPEYKEVLG